MKYLLDSPALYGLRDLKTNANESYITWNILPKSLQFFFRRVATEIFKSNFSLESLKHITEQIIVKYWQNSKKKSSIISYVKYFAVN